jgi:phosphohistidine phosphatase
MILYFLRHAHAEDDSSEGDHARRLTEQGITAAQNLAQLLARMKLTPKHIYSSPRVRAVQTAEIVANALNQPFEQREEVNVGFGLPAVVRLTESLPVNSEVMFVGHEPTLSATLHLITGANLVMKKCGFACVELTHRTPVRGNLIWLLTPRVAAGLNGLNAADTIDD